MADAPTADMLTEFKRLWKEANEVSRNHDEFLTLMFMSAVDLNRSRTDVAEEW